MSSGLVCNGWLTFQKGSSSSLTAGNSAWAQEQDQSQKNPNGAEEMGVKCKVEGELKELGEEGRYDCVYRITL
jgi:hypothetical protein